MFCSLQGTSHVSSSHMMIPKLYTSAATVYGQAAEDLGRQPPRVAGHHAAQHDAVLHHPRQIEVADLVGAAAICLRISEDAHWTGIAFAQQVTSGTVEVAVCTLSQQSLESSAN